MSLMWYVQTNMQTLCPLQASMLYLHLWTIDGRMQTMKNSLWVITSCLTNTLKDSNQGVKDSLSKQAWIQIVECSWTPWIVVENAVDPCRPLQRSFISQQVSLLFFKTSILWQLSAYWPDNACPKPLFISRGRNTKRGQIHWSFACPLLREQDKLVFMLKEWTTASAIQIRLLSPKTWREHGRMTRCLSRMTRWSSDGFTVLLLCCK